MAININDGNFEQSGLVLREVQSKEEFLYRWKPVLEIPSLMSSVWIFIGSSFLGSLVPSVPEYAAVKFCVDLLLTVVLFRFLYSFIVWRKFYNIYSSVYGFKFLAIFKKKRDLVFHFGVTPAELEQFKPALFWMLKPSTIALPVPSQDLNNLTPLTNDMQVRTRDEFLERWGDRLLHPSIGYGWLWLLFLMSSLGGMDSFGPLYILLSFILMISLATMLYSTIRWMIFVRKHRNIYGSKTLNISRHKYELMKFFDVNFIDLVNYRIAIFSSELGDQKKLDAFLKNYQRKKQQNVNPSTNEDFVSTGELLNLPVQTFEVITTPGFSYGTPIDPRVSYLNKIDPNNSP